MDTFGVASPKYYGFYRGVVRDNNDPATSGRIQVQIMPMFQGVTLADLPWAIPAYPVVTGSGDGIGYFAVPAVGTFVYCFFEEGDIFQPVYCFEAPTLTKGIPGASATNYPNSRVIQTPGGFIVVMNDTDPSFSLFHPSGSVLNIDNEGNINIVSSKKVQTQSVDDTNILSTKSIALSSTINTTVDAVGLVNISGTVSTTVTSLGAVTVEGGGVVDIRGGGIINIEGGAAINITGTGVVTIEGSVINLNT